MCDDNMVNASWSNSPGSSPPETLRWILGQDVLLSQYLSTQVYKLNDGAPKPGAQVCVTGPGCSKAR